MNEYMFTKTPSRTVIITADTYEDAAEEFMERYGYYPYKEQIIPVPIRPVGLVFSGEWNED